jgi:peptide/nickel transport system ATP-binding protein
VEKVFFNAISDLNLTVRKGEIVAVVGSSGSGKSLLAHAVMNILPDNARVGGTMYYKGKRLTPEVMNRLRGHEIAFIPQSVAFLDPLMQVGDQVTGTLGEKARALQQKAFAHFGLKQEVANYYPFQLSGGMARRVLLSTSYVTETEMIIADEPTPGLDLKIAIEALQDFRVQADQGKGVILITHDIDLALHVADKIAIFYDGCVVETADTETFRGDGQGLRHPYSQALFHALPQNGFNLPRCPRCGATCATWDVDEKGMRCGCGNS